MTVEEYKPKTSERDVQKSICEYLTLRGILHTVSDSSVAWTPKGGKRQKVRTGWPDITCILAPFGLALFIEVKSSAGLLRPSQIEMLNKLRAAGALTLVARSANDVREFVDAVLTELKGEPGRKNWIHKDGRAGQR